jgi:homoserine kinase type II
MAVYTDVADADLEDLIKQYDLGALLSCKGIAEGVENSNFLLRTEAGNFILTLYERRVAEADLPFFLGLMEHLAERGIRCPLPVKGRDGEMLRRVAGRPAAIVSFLEGMWVRRPQAGHCAAVGRALAEMHAAGGGFRLSRPNALSVGGWRELFKKSADRANSIEPDLRALVAKELDFLEENWPRELRLQRLRGLRSCRLPERLVLRAGSQLQRDQGTGADPRL